MPSKSITPLLGRVGMTVVLIVGLIGSEAYGAGISLLLDSGPITGGSRVNKRVKSLLELRQERVILQNLDYSCGAAALATVGFHACKNKLRTHNAFSPRERNRLLAISSRGSS